MAEGSRQLFLSQEAKVSKANDIAHVVCWIGDIAFLYIEKRSQKPEISIEVNFPELMNLQCISHPNIKRSDQWTSFKFVDKFLIIFEKIDLTAETHIRQYFLEAFWILIFLFLFSKNLLKTVFEYFSENKSISSCTK